MSGPHEYKGTMPSRAMRRQSKIGAGAIDSRRLAELLWLDALRHRDPVAYARALRLRAGVHCGDYSGLE